MTPEQEISIRYAHSALVDYLQYLRLWSSNRLEEVRLITDISSEIKELNETIFNLEKDFPFVDPDNSNFL